MADDFDLVIVGMGSGGMVAAEFAATLGVRVAVAERGRVGGDCLWTGCVPSKALLASGKIAHHMRHADEWGLPPAPPMVDRVRVWDRIRAVRQQVADTDDNPDRYRGMGIEIVAGHARVAGPNRVVVQTNDGDRALSTRYVLLCTGSRPVVPPIDGLEDVGFVTSESLYELRDPPASFVNIGGGPVGVEMAQGFTRLGIPTTLLQRGPRVLPRDEPALVDLLLRELRDEGVDLHVNVTTESVTRDGAAKVVHGTEHGEPRTWEADELLVAVGRRPNIEHLGLEELGITTEAKSVRVDKRGRTSVDTIYACGDLAGRHVFTHSAAYEGVRAVRDMFFPGQGKVVASVPWCTFTDPELAHAGLTEAEAHARYTHGVEVWRQDLIHNDRARADGATAGAVIVVTHRKRVVGAHILAPAAGEMIHELALAIEQDVSLSDLSRFMHVYPTASTSIGELAGEAAFEKADKLRWLVKRR